MLLVPPQGGGEGREWDIECAGLFTSEAWPWACLENVFGRCISSQVPTDELTINFEDGENYTWYL